MTDTALNAYKQLQEQKRSQGTEKYSPFILLYIDVLRAVGQQTFTAQHFCKWYEIYKANMPAEEFAEVSDLVGNAYSVGRHLRKAHLDYGLDDVGTYGNRQVYQIQDMTPEEDNT